MDEDEWLKLDLPEKETGMYISAFDELLEKQVAVHHGLLDECKSLIQKKEDLLKQIADCEEFEESRRRKKSQELEGRISSLEKLTGNIESLKKENEMLLLEKENLEDSVKRKEEAIYSKTSEIEKAVATESLKALASELKYYEEWLGLEIRKVSGGRLQFIMSNIDKHNPEKIFCFSILVDSNKIYTISGCRPMIDSTLLQRMTDKLNETNDLRSFVINMRKQFKLMTCKQ